MTDRFVDWKLAMAGFWFVVATVAYAEHLGYVPVIVLYALLVSAVVLESAAYIRSRGGSA